MSKVWTIKVSRNLDKLVKELVEDLIAIVTSFAGRLYGMRSHKKKKVVESVKQAIRDC